MKESNNKNLIYLIVFFAGFSFLIYEVSWNRYLSLLLGTSVTASTIVLTAFMAGFGFGALKLGNIANKSQNLGKLLAFLLGGIGIVSFLNFFIVSNSLRVILNFTDNQSIINLLFYIITFILLLIPAFFMGGIIPLVSKIAISENKSFGTKIGKIYAFETLGSTIGGLITGFFLLGTIGQMQTIFVAVFINLLLATYIFLTKKFSSLNIIIEEKKSKKNDNLLSINQKIALISTFTIGFAMLSLQIIWIRIFRTYFTNTSYTFTLITAFVILGLSIGSWIYKKKSSQIKNPRIAILRAIILITILSLLGLVLLQKLPEIILFPLNAFAENQYFRILVIPVISSILIILPPAIISGFTFPLACKMNSSNTENTSKDIGKILTFNTIGSVIAPSIATFLLIPFLGAGKSILIIAMILTASSLYISLTKSGEKDFSIYKKILIVKLPILIIIFFAISEIQFIPPSVNRYKKEILTYKETVEGTIIVAKDKNKGIFGKSTFVNNSSVIGSNYDAIKAVKMVGHIPFFANLKCKNALIIGFGIGVTTSAIASHSEVKSIDCVELVSDLKDFAYNYSDFNHKVYNNKKLNIMSGDGRHFLQTTNKKYDLISCDPTHPVLGSGNLYTQEYFTQVYEHLTQDGMTSQYLPLHKLRLEDLLGIIKTFHSVFENSSVWLGQYHAILIGKKGKGKIDFSTWKTKVKQMPKDDFFYLNPYHIAANVIFDSDKIDNFPKNIKINTDNLSYTEFFSFDCFYNDNLPKNLKYFTENRCNINKVFENIDDTAKMNHFINGNIALTQSVYYAIKNDKQNSLNSLRKAVKVNPEDQEFPFLIKLYYRVKK